jgi:hypothetical protein
MAEEALIERWLVRQSINILVWIAISMICIPTSLGASLAEGLKRRRFLLDVFVECSRVAP